MTDDDVGCETPDLPAAETRWARLRTTLTRAVQRQCPRWLSDHADDLAQAALLKVMAVIERSEGDRPLSSFYLHRVAHSALVDEIRRRQRRREVSLDAQDDEGSTGDGLAALPDANDPEQEASLRELGSAVRGCLLSMIVDRRRAVMLYLQGHSVPDAARVLGWSAKRTENLVYRGLADLRQCLRAKGHGP